METLQTHPYVLKAQTTAGEKKVVNEGDPQEFQSLLDPKATPAQGKGIKGNAKGGRNIKNDALLAKQLLQQGKAHIQLQPDQAIILLDQSQEPAEAKNKNVNLPNQSSKIIEMLEAEENLQNNILSQKLSETIPLDTSAIPLEVDPGQGPKHASQMPHPQVGMMKQKPGIVANDPRQKSIGTVAGNPGVKIENQKMQKNDIAADVELKTDVSFPEVSKGQMLVDVKSQTAPLSEQAFTGVKANVEKKMTSENVHNASVLDFSMDELATAENEGVLIKNQDRRPDRKSMFHIQKQIDELPATQTHKSLAMLVENEFERPTPIKILSENDFAIKNKKDSERPRIISESQLDMRSALAASNDNNQANASQSVLDSQTTKNLNSTSEASAVGQLQLEKLDTADSREILNQIKNHVMQMSEAGKDRAELTVNSSVLGKFKIEVERKSVGPKQDIEVTLHSQARDGHEILVENKSDLLKHLEGAGLRVVDLKINGPGERTAQNQVSFAESQSLRYNKQEEGHQQDSQRRRELWEEAKRARS